MAIQSACQETVLWWVPRDTGNVESSGAAYLFGFDGQNWMQSHRFTVADMNACGQLGESVSLSGNRVLIGASRENTNGSYSGSVYVFDSVNNNWILSEKLIPSDNTARDEFGVSMSFPKAGYLLALTEMVTKAAILVQHMSLICLIR